jgi:hypothetical protein
LDWAWGCGTVCGGDGERSSYLLTVSDRLVHAPGFFGKVGRAGATRESEVRDPRSATGEPETRVPGRMETAYSIRMTFTVSSNRPATTRMK